MLYNQYYKKGINYKLITESCSEITNQKPKHLTTEGSICYLLMFGKSAGPCGRF